MMHKRYPIFVVLAIALMISFATILTNGAHAARKADGTKLSQSQVEAIQKITAYFNKLRDLQGEFVQSGPGNYLGHGIFYLSKPGLLRFEYAAPNPLLVVSDGTWVKVINRKRETEDNFPLSATPLKLVLADKVDILNQTKIISVHEDRKIISVTLEDKSILVPGRLTFVFDKKSKELRQWVVIDGQGKSTTIAMSKLKKGVKADPKLFKFRLPNKIISDEYAQ